MFKLFIYLFGGVHEAREAEVINWIGPTISGPTMNFFYFKWEIYILDPFVNICNFFLSIFMIFFLYKNQWKIYLMLRKKEISAFVDILKDALSIQTSLFLTHSEYYYLKFNQIYCHFLYPPMSIYIYNETCCSVCCDPRNVKLSK